MGAERRGVSRLGERLSLSGCMPQVAYAGIGYPRTGSGSVVPIGLMAAASAPLGSPAPFRAPPVRCRVPGLGPSRARLPRTPGYGVRSLTTASASNRPSRVRTSRGFAARIGPLASKPRSTNA